MKLTDLESKAIAELQLFANEVYYQIVKNGLTVKALNKWSYDSREYGMDIPYLKIHSETIRWTNGKEVKDINLMLKPNP